MALLLKFLNSPNCFLTTSLHRLLFIALIQPLFHYGCAAWFSNLSKSVKLRFQASRNKCRRLRLQIDKRSKKSVLRVFTLNWQNVHDRYLRFIVSNIFKFCNNQCRYYFVLSLFVVQSVKS